MARRPNVNAEAQLELEKIERQIAEKKAALADLDMNKRNEAPVLEVEPEWKKKQTQNQMAESTAIYLKPARSVSSREKFNPRFENDYNFKKERVLFVAENQEVKGEAIEMWSKPFPGLPCEFWIIPVGKKVNAPRYVAEQIKECVYHVMKSEELPTSPEHGTQSGALIVQHTMRRLDAMPVTETKSIFMGAA